jgi:hypothetical protein
MRGLIAVTILCLTAMPAFACVLDNDCANKPGTICVDGDCIGTTVGDDADNAQDNTPYRELESAATTTAIAATAPSVSRARATRASA